MLKYIVGFPLCLIALAFIPARAEDKPAKKLQPLPWHLADAWPMLDKDREIDSLSVDVQFLNDIPMTGCPLFIVPLSGMIGSEVFYVGVETQDMYANNDKEAYRVKGSGYIFTKFGEARRESLRVANGGHTLVSNHEGPHSGLRVEQKFACKAGRYTFQLTKQPNIDKSESANFSLDVYSHKEKSKQEIGSITFKAPSANTLRWLACFFEVTQSWDEDKKRWRAKDENLYGDSIPECRIAIGNWRVNGQGFSPATCEYMHYADLPQKARVVSYKSIDENTAKKIDKELQDEKTILIETGDTPYDRSEPEVEVTYPGTGGKKKVRGYRGVLYRDDDK